MGAASTTSTAEGHDSRAFRNALGAFSTGVTVVTCRCPLQGARGVTINSFSSLSLEPPLIVWSLAVRASSHASFAAADHFAVHVLSASQADLAHRFAKSGADRPDGIALVEGPRGLPILPEAAARFECRKMHRYWGGDHSLFVGQVEAFTHDPTLAPLIFHAGRMRHLLPV